jgi:ABC-2 type transport system permease protein
MNRVLTIAQREYMDTIRTKAFIFGVVFAPLIMVAAMVIAMKMSETKNKPRQEVNVAIVDTSGKLGPQIDVGFSKYNKKNPQRRINARVEQADGGMESVDKRMKDQLLERKLDIYVAIDPNLVGGSGLEHIYTHKIQAVNADAVWAIRDIINRVVINERCRLRNMSPAELSAISNVNSEEVEVGKAAPEKKKGSGSEMVNMMVPFFFMYLMFIGVLSIGPHMIGSLIEEKNSRIIEVLLSAVSPHELMFGKIVGLGGVGLTVVSFWAVVARGAATWMDLPVYIPPAMLVWFAVYYVLGFLFFGAIMAGIGSVCNTLKESQSFMLPISMTMVIPLIAWQSFTQSPNGVVARTMSFIPPMTPLVMIVRLASGSEIWWVEKVGAVAVLALSVAVAIWAAGKVFRVGVLMYGKKPGLAEIGRMILEK